MLAVAERNGIGARDATAKYSMAKCQRPEAVDKCLQHDSYLMFKRFGVRSHGLTGFSEARSFKE